MKDLLKALLITVIILVTLSTASFIGTVHSPPVIATDRFIGQDVMTSINYYDMIELTTSLNDTVIIRDVINRSANSLVGLRFITPIDNCPLVLQDSLYLSVFLTRDVICYINPR